MTRSTLARAEGVLSRRGNRYRNPEIQYRLTDSRNGDMTIARRVMGRVRVESVVSWEYTKTKNNKWKKKRVGKWIAR